MKKPTPAQASLLGFKPSEIAALAQTELLTDTADPNPQTNGPDAQARCDAHRPAGLTLRQRTILIACTILLMLALGVMIAR